jgi:FkbM family methyltransferase
MFHSLRIKLIKKLIDINEKIFFERRLLKTYKASLGNKLNTIIDVGANKGQSISFFRKMNKNCKIYAFEPNAALYDQLMATYGKLPGIKIYNMGISDKTGEKMFNQNVLDYTSSFEELNLDSKYLQNKSNILGVKPEEIVSSKYMVNITTLSKFINENVTEPIDILKIDVEGHEYAALKGLFNSTIKQTVRYIQLEDHTDDMYLNKISFDTISQLLAENGFRLKASIRHGFGKINEVIFFNENA